MSGPGTARSGPRADPSYEVGYKKPPQATQFKSGVSGNPSGRRTSPPTLSQRLDRILAEKIEVSERGQSRRISKEEVFLRQMVAKAISGDRQFGRLVLDYLQRRQLAGPAGTTSDTDEFLLGELETILTGQAK